jgi:hypothetical protein
MKIDTGLARELWLTMLREGGRWTARELEEQLPAEMQAAKGARSVLLEMARIGMATRYGTQPTGGTVGRKPYAYGVTPECRMPRAVTVGDVLACVKAPA